MGNEAEGMQEKLILKEESLLENSTRNDPSLIEKLMDDNCIEFSASGRQRVYRRGDKMENADGVLYIDSATVRSINLSEDCILLLYVGVKVNKNVRTKSNCSSVWKKTDGEWKMVFHQGTNIPE
jgi:ribonuclease HI